MREEKKKKKIFHSSTFSLSHSHLNFLCYCQQVVCALYVYGTATQLDGHFATMTFFHLMPFSHQKHDMYMSLMVSEEREWCSAWLSELQFSISSQTIVWTLECWRNCANLLTVLFRGIFSKCQFFCYPFGVFLNVCRLIIFSWKWDTNVLNELFVSFKRHLAFFLWIN